MPAMILLANAERTDPNSNLQTILICAFIILICGVVAFIPVLISWSRRHRHSEKIVILALLWGLATVLSVTTTTLAQMKYQYEHQMAFMSGFYDPKNTSEQPPLPILTWGGPLGLVYIALDILGDVCCNPEHLRMNIEDLPPRPVLRCRGEPCVRPGPSCRGKGEHKVRPLQEYRAREIMPKWSRLVRPSEHLTITQNVGEASNLSRLQRHHAGKIPAFSTRCAPTSSIYSATPRA